MDKKMADKKVEKDDIFPSLEPPQEYSWRSLQKKINRLDSRKKTVRWLGPALLVGAGALVLILHFSSFSYFSQKNDLLELARKEKGALFVKYGFAAK